MNWQQGFAPDGHQVFVAEQAARTHLDTLAADHRLPQQIAAGGTIRAPHIAADSNLYYTWQSFQQPPEIFHQTSRDTQPRQITHFTTDAMRGIALGEVREIQCAGYGGETVQSFVVLPPGHQTGAPAPFVNIVHGGPHRVWGDEFHFRGNAQLFATAGYIDASDAPQGRGRSFGGEPWSGLDAIDEYNPARFADGMTTPMLVIHGELDYRVPVTQGLECYGVLQAKGVPARLVHFPDENHWILKPHNSIRWYTEVFNWLSRWLN